MRIHRPLLSLALMLAATACADAPGAPAVLPLADQNAEDPFLWLEEVLGDSALAWVHAHNASTLAELQASEHFDPILQRTVEILDSDERIAHPTILGDRLYNFWQDATHPRGVWRRTSWEGYLSGSPEWETVLDIDALSAAEGVTWSYAGANCLGPEYRLCLVNLSRGGADATEVREFDLGAKRFVAGGFQLPEAKQGTAWVDENAILVNTNFGEGTLTTSGYARIAKLWRRGTPLSEAKTLFEAPVDHMSVGVGTWETADRRLNVVRHNPAFFQTAYHVLRGEELVKLDIQLDADPLLLGDRLILYLRTPWEVGETTYPAGSLVHTSFDEFLAGGRDFGVIVEPTERQTIDGVSTTKDFLLVKVLDNVKAELRRYRFADGSWVHETVPAPEMGNIGVGATSDHDNRYFFSYSGFTQPNTLYLAEDDGSVRPVKSLPPMFDAAGLTVRQFEATSRDGTRIPYFLVSREGAALDGTNPTLLYAYGGFEISSLPGYNAVTGTAWLERGGTYVLANIRGGGEFGPAWHRAGLLENRQRVYDDMIAVAEDLIDRGITSPRHLGIMGGSNGGLLMGAMLTQRPELFGAVVVQVPLFDMRRYHLLLAGASWMAEYGNPDDPAQWEYIGRYSPYQHLVADRPYPKVLFTTTTRDDRVHPGHARKAAAKLEALGYPVLYFENTEGGHGAGVTSEQRARSTAVTFTYLWEQLK